MFENKYGDGSSLLSYRHCRLLSSRCLLLVSDGAREVRGFLWQVPPSTSTLPLLTQLLCFAAVGGRIQLGQRYRGRRQRQNEDKASASWLMLWAPNRQECCSGVVPTNQPTGCNIVGWKRFLTLIGRSVARVLFRPTNQPVVILWAGNDF